MICKRNLNMLRKKKNKPSQKKSPCGFCFTRLYPTIIDLLKVLTFVQGTMQTLSNYSGELQKRLDINLTHQ